MRALLIDPWTMRGSPLRLLAEPEWSFREGVGFEQATLVPVLTEAQKAWCERALVCLVDDACGAFWWGLANNKPTDDGSIICAGMNALLLQSRRAADYCNTALDWEERQNNDANRNSAFVINTDANLLRFVLPDSTAIASNAWNGAHKRIVPTTAGRIVIPWTRPNTNWRLKVYVAEAGGGTYSEPFTLVEQTVAGGPAVPSGSGGTTGTLTLDCTAAGLSGGLITDIFVAWTCMTGYTTGTNTRCSCGAVKWYGTPVTSVTTGSILGHIADTDIASRYLFGTAKAYIGAENTLVEPLTFADSDDADTKVKAVSPFADWHWGWYSENGLPMMHWQPRSTTPDYVLDLSRAEEADIQEGTVEDMASAIRCHYTDVQGHPLYVDVYAADHYPTQYLVLAGETVWAQDVTVPTNSADVATSAGVLALADLGRRQTKGSGTWGALQTITRTQVPPTVARPGQMVRLMRRDGFSDTIIRRVSGKGSAGVKLELDNLSYRLDHALALLSKNSQFSRQRNVSPPAYVRTR